MLGFTNQILFLSSFMKTIQYKVIVGSIIKQLCMKSLFLLGNVELLPKKNKLRSGVGHEGSSKTKRKKILLIKVIYY